MTSKKMQVTRRYNKSRQQHLEAKREKADHSKKVKMFHEQRMQGLATVNQINNQVKEFNRQRLNTRQPYFDLHGMTPDGAVEYVRIIVDWMRGQKLAKVQIETGRGNGSPNKRPAIKIELLKRIHGWSECSLVPEDNNDGVLVLTVC